MPTCALDDTISDVPEASRAVGVCVVLHGDCVVGLVTAGALAHAPDTPVEAVMEQGPSTVRPSMRVEELEKAFRQRKLRRGLVTTLDGKLFGLVRPDDLDKA
jgi:Mg/Co/Ni transporter MgtE